MSEHDDIEIVEDEDAGAAKIAKLKKELDVCKAEKEDYLKGWQRAKADYINAERAMALRLEEAGKAAQTHILLELIDVADSFEKALSGGAPDSRWAEGVRQIYEQLAGTLKRFGVEAIEARGKPFDPRFHEAIESI
ncbi:MAG: nucleotide exchange factor GrpE, partial [Candidatus Ryanbacteria bacterium]|nr:nucleotide exchange factor GrpE [Candidatus Ryanbacteria bacterium]